MTLQQIVKVVMQELFFCQIKWKKIHPEALLPEKAKPGDSGFDVFAVEDFTLRAGIVQIVPTGLQLADITPGFEIQVRNRSGHAAKGVTITNSPGTVDNGYRGALGIIMLKDHCAMSFTKGQKIAQLVPARVAEATNEWVETVTETERGAGGYGSTDKGG